VTDTRAAPVSPPSTSTRPRLTPTATRQRGPLTRRPPCAASPCTGKAVELGDEPPARCDLVFMGAARTACSRPPPRPRPPAALAVGVIDDGGVVFAVCAGLQPWVGATCSDGSELSGSACSTWRRWRPAGEWRLIAQRRGRRGPTRGRHSGDSGRSLLQFLVGFETSTNGAAALSSPERLDTGFAAAHRRVRVGFGRTVATAARGPHVLGA